MGREEQKEEREVLDSIFPDEITDVSESEYRISMTLDVTGEEGLNDEARTSSVEARNAGQGLQVLATILLQVQYPENYPDEAPRLDISAPPNAPKHRYLDIQEDKARLLEALEPTIEENLGMAMVFTLVSTLKDSAELLISERRQAVQAEKEFEAQKTEEEENAKFHGTAVTRESFLEWRERFRREMEEAEKRRQGEALAEEKKKRSAKEEVRLTGKQLWERGLAGRGEGDEDDDEGDSVDVSKLKIAA